MSDEVKQLRAKLAAMHRRAQAAESQIGVTIEDCIRQGRSLGRSLANAGYLAERDKRIAAEADRDRLQAAVDAVEKLHRRDGHRTIECCVTCETTGWPCVTARALTDALAASVPSPTAPAPTGETNGDG